MLGAKDLGNIVSGNFDSFSNLHNVDRRHGPASEYFFLDDVLSCFIEDVVSLDSWDIAMLLPQ